MNPDVKRQWVEALRSGEYEQTQKRLAKWHNNYCCLGVLCELAYKQNIVEKGQMGGAIVYDYSKAELPDSVIQWADLPDPTVPVTRDDGSESSLIVLNDNGKPFSEIANIIEQQL